MFDFLKGKKTYLVAATAAVLAALSASGIAIPVWVYPLLGSLGLGSLRAGVTKEGK